MLKDIKKSIYRVKLVLNRALAVDIDARTDEDSTARNCSTTLSSEIAQKLEAEVLELRVEVKKLRETCVSRDEYTSIVIQVKKYSLSYQYICIS